MAKNYDSVFLTNAQPNSAFDWRATRTYVWSFSRCEHGSNFQNFDLERLWTFTPMVPKVSLQYFLPILGRSIAENYDSVFLTEEQPNGSTFQIFHLKRVFCFQIRRRWFRKFPSTNFHQFQPPCGQTLRFCLFDQGATK